MMGVSEVQEYVDEVLDVLQNFLPIIDCHMVDFLTCDLWNKCVPDSIKEEVHYLGPDKAYKLFSQKEKSNTQIQKFLDSAAFVSSLGILNSEELWTSLHSFGGKADKTDPRLSMFMSAKKAHEVQVLSSVITCVAKIKDIGCVIDLGGGKGYLGFTLAYHYGLRVLSIDSAQDNTHGALKLANNLKKWWNTMQQRTCPETAPSLDKMYKQITTFVHPETNLVEIVHKEFQNDGLKNVNLDKFCLVGLHACGNLTPSCLRLFCANSYIKALCIIGCCYNLITENPGPADTEECGFPMSQYLKRKGFRLSRNARMLAAQSMERILQEDKAPPVSLWYRTLFQVLLTEREESTDFQVGRSKPHIRTFSEYVSNALTRLKLAQASSEEIEKVQTRYHNWQKLHDVFFMMRVTLAPVIESLILLDRHLFLLEQDLKHTYLVRLFDSVISPRCCGIIAFKD